MERTGQSQPFRHVERYTARDTDDYLLEIDELSNGEQQFCMVHFEVFRWAPSVFKQMKREWALLRQCIRCPLFAAVPASMYDDKWHKFVTAFGFKPSMSVLTERGEPREMYVNND